MDNKTNNLIGGRLKKARIKKSVSLEDVYEKTKIHPRILTALEEDHAEETISPIYRKAFLRTYSRYLGLDSDEFIKKVLEDREPEKKFHPDTTGGVFKEERLARKTNLKKILFPVIVFFSAVAVIFMIGFTGLKLIKGVKNTFNRARVALAAKKTGTTAKESAKFKPIPKNEKLVLGLKTSDEVWAQVKSDDKIVFRSILPKGSSEVWKADKSLSIWVGKAEAVRLTLNSQELGSPGKGTIKNIAITREGMKVGK